MLVAGSTSCMFNLSFLLASQLAPDCTFKRFGVVCASDAL